MQFLLLVYTDESMLDALPEGRFDSMMRSCVQLADSRRPAAVSAPALRYLIAAGEKV
ncbi:MAG: hypothetical protein ACR2J7_08960 [Luteimonas sp.]